MKVILLKDVGGTGKKDDIKEVADGFALNSLIPKGMAAQATPQRLSDLKRKKEAAATAHKDIADQWEKHVKRLQNVNILVAAKVNDQGNLYRQVHAEEIVENVQKRLAITLPPESIQIMSSIRTLGSHPIQINLGPHKIRALVTVKKL